MNNFENSPPSATSARARRRQRREPLQFYTVAEVAESHSAGATAQKPSAPTIVLLTPKEAAKLLKISRSWWAPRHPAPPKPRPAHQKGRHPPSTRPAARGGPGAACAARARRTSSLAS